MPTTTYIRDRNLMNAPSDVSSSVLETRCKPGIARNHVSHTAAGDCRTAISTPASPPCLEVAEGSPIADDGAAAAAARCHSVPAQNHSWGGPICVISMMHPKSFGW